MDIALDITFNMGELTPAVPLLRKVVLKNEELSILSVIIIENIGAGKEYNIIIRCNNVEVGIQVRVLGKIRIDGFVCLKSDIFYDLMKDLENKKINITKSKKNVVFLKGSDYSASLDSLNKHESGFFRGFPETEDLIFVPVEKRKFINIISRTIYCISDEESHYNLSGLYLIPRNANSEIIAAAMDGFRMSYLRIKMKEEFENRNYSRKYTVLSKRKAMELIDLLKVRFDTPIFEIAIAKKAIIAKHRNVYFFSRIVEPEYPDFSNIIPEYFSEILIFERKKLIMAIRRVSSLSDTVSCSIVFSFNNNSLALFYYNLGTQKRGDVSESMEIKTFLNINITMNSKFLLECLNSLDGKNIFFKFIDEQTGVYFFNETETHACIIMPIRID